MAAKRTQHYDVAIIGAGPAGAVAALRARQLGAATLLLDRETFPRPRSCVGWISPAGVELAQRCGVSKEDVAAEEFHGLYLHAWDLKRRVEVQGDNLRGWLVDRAAFDQALCKAAQASGARFRHGATIDDVRFGEQSVEIMISGGGGGASAGVLLIADGASSSVARMARLVPAAAVRGEFESAFVEMRCPDEGPRLDVAIGAGSLDQLATMARAHGRVRVALASRMTQTPIERQLAEFCRAAAAANLLPQRAPAVAASCPIPAGAALEMEAHVGKRCLLIGDAGGFVSAFSFEGVYPAMKSGWIAAETAVRAGAAAVVQDELATFDEAWRRELAEYLQRPNTDLSLLLPLVFGNEQMSRRVGRAFLLGQGL